MPMLSHPHFQRHNCVCPQYVLARMSGCVSILYCEWFLGCLCVSINVCAPSSQMWLVPILSLVLVVKSSQSRYFIFYTVIQIEPNTQRESGKIPQLQDKDIVRSDPNAGQKTYTHIQRLFSPPPPCTFSSRQHTYPVIIVPQAECVIGMRVRCTRTVG